MILCATMKTSKVITTALATVVLVLAAIAFIWVPAMGSTGSVKDLGVWDSKSITNEPASPYYSKLQYVQRLFDAFGGTVPNDEATREYFNYQLSNTALSSSIIDLAMETEVEKMGYTPSDRLINIGLISQFTDQTTGAYSQAIYDNTSEATKLQLRNDIISNLKRTRYIYDLLGYNGNFGLKPSSKEAPFVAEMNTEKRKLNYVSFKPIHFPVDKIREYGEAHSDLFVKYDFSIVSFQDENAASSVSREILKGSVQFDDALKSQDTSITNPYVDSNGTLTNSYRKDLNSLFPNAEDLSKIISLKVGEISTPVKMNSLYVVLKCNSEPVQPDFQDTSLIDQVSYYMRQYEKGIIEDYLMQHAEDFIAVAKEKDFGAACLEFMAEPTTTDFFGINYGNSQFLNTLPEGDALFSSIAKNEDVFTSLFTLNVGEYAKPFLLNESVYIATVAEIQEKAPVEESAISNYTAENQNWSDYYTLALLTGQFPMGLAQSTVIDFILENPKAQNNLYKYSN